MSDLSGKETVPELADVGVPVEDAGVSLPTPEEYKTENAATSSGPSSTSWSGRLTRKWKIGLAAGAALLVLIIGLSVGLSGKKKSATSTQPLTGGADGGNSNKYEKAVNFLIESGVSSRAALTTEDTPQNKAVNWLTNEDTHDRDVPDSVSENGSFYYIQRYVVSVMYFAMGGETWSTRAHFKSNKFECDWNEGLQAGIEVFKYGVSCANGEQISDIFMPSNNIAGSFPAEIGYLTKLTHLSLFQNSISGNLPSSLQKLSEIDFFGMEQNSITGSIPSWFSSWSKIQFLALGSNGFTGRIPTTLSSMSMLTELALDNNQISGSIESLKNLPNLQRLYIGHNKLGGVINDQFFKGSRIKELDISNNTFSGTVPQHFFNDGVLEILDVHSNKMTGPIHWDITRNEKLSYFSAYDNMLTGKLPETVNNLNALTHLDVSDNNFTGEMPSALANMHLLKYLFVSNNNFEPGPIPNYRGISLQELSLKGTNRNGTIPRDIGDLSRLVLLDLGNNALVGTLPHQINTLTNLKYLLLNQNRISGTITIGFEGLQNLEMVLLDKNDIHGGATHVCGLDRQKEIKVLSADCSEEFDCECCTICCDDAEQNCYKDEQLLPNLDLEWENKFSSNNVYDRDEYIFSEDIKFTIHD